VTRYLSTIAVQFVVIVLGFLSSVITARVLGADGRGVYFLATTFASIVLQLSNLGLQGSNTYRVSRDTQMLGPLAANSLWAAVCAGTLVSALGTVLLWTWGFVSAAELPFLAVAALYVPANMFCMLGINLLVGYGRPELYNLYLFAYTVWNLVANITAAFTMPTVNGFLLASVAGNWLPAIALLVWLPRFAGASLKFRPDVFRQCAGYAFRSYVATAFGFLILRCNVFILNRYSTDVDLGTFSVASQIGDVLNILPTSVALLLFPHLVRQKSDRWATLLHHLRDVGLILALACAVAALTVAPFVRLVFGASFADAAPTLYYMLPGCFFVGMTSIVSPYLNTHGFPVRQVVAWALAFVVLLAASFVLIPLYKGHGAALALSIAHLALFVMIFAVAVDLRRRVESESTPASPLAARVG